MAASNLKIPNENDKHEMAGRMYEALDIQRAIESGQLNAIEDVLQAVKRSAASLDSLLKAEAWVVNESGCCDIPASIRREAVN